MVGLMSDAKEAVVAWLVEVDDAWCVDDAPSKADVLARYPDGSIGPDDVRGVKARQAHGLLTCKGCGKKV